MAAVVVKRLRGTSVSAGIACLCFNDNMFPAAPYEVLKVLWYMCSVTLYVVKQLKVPKPQSALSSRFEAVKIRTSQISGVNIQENYFKF
jgi:hypothetical protein